MSSVNLNKNWMKASRLTYDFLNGVRDATIDAHIQNPNESLITQHDDVERPRIFDLVDDAFGYIQPENLNEGIQVCSYEVVDEFPEEEIEYQMLKDDASHPLYPLCLPDNTMLSATIELMSLKSNCQLSDSAFTMLLVLLKQLLPKDNTLQESMYAATKMITCLGMNYENIVKAA
ncbi:hypothetical protein GIB67_015703 [Kingdonia uniflora]|uniref:Uncharacterized protein n=1 Tax=Kingdonia uniflora TaxID=39325 RepID=A0A7J7NU94_9MAGN|nr:hypothetical protein GIB67_015703 [Kingdonia uniflora]